MFYQESSGCRSLASLAFAPGYATSAAQGGAKSTCTAPLSTPPAPLPPAAAIRRSIWTLFLSDRSFVTARMTKPFSIELVNCILERPENKPDWKFFQVTFDGYAEGALFGVQGDARGVALEIKTAAARRLFQETFADGGNNTGKPSAELFHDVDAESPAVEGGAYFSTVRFKLDYF